MVDRENFDNWPVLAQPNMNRFVACADVEIGYVPGS